MRMPFKRARGIRNGLMLAMLAINPMRRKKLCGFEIGTTFKQAEGQWWISVQLEDQNQAAARGTAGRHLAQPVH